MNHFNSYIDRLKQLEVLRFRELHHGVMSSRVEDLADLNEQVLIDSSAFLRNLDRLSAEPVTYESFKRVCDWTDYFHPTLSEVRYSPTIYREVNTDWLDQYIDVASEFNGRRIVQLNEELRKLTKEFRETKNARVYSRIRQIAGTLKSLLLARVEKYSRKTRGIRRNLCLTLKRNLRTHYRQIIQFTFKNLDDESHDAVIALQIVKSNRFTKNFIHHELQRKGYHRTKRDYL